MATTDNRLIDKIQNLLSTWKEQRLPGSATLHDIADDLLDWRMTEGVPGLWLNPPVMFGATLDDGWGHGIQLILKYADALGCQTEFLGLLLSWEEISNLCQKHEPDILGLTVLQFDTEEAIAVLRKHIPKKTKIVAGGPVFKIDDELALRMGIDYVAGDAADFLAYLVKWMILFLMGFLSL